MIATTIISSIKVKPELSLFIPLSYSCLAESSAVYAFKGRGFDGEIGVNIDP
jgi:hypothetical protein